MTNHLGRILTGLCFTSLLLIGCASDRIVFHSFEFDAKTESPDIELLDYRYGIADLPGTRGKLKEDDNQVAQQAGVGGDMPVEDFLFVKWRIRDTGEVLEDRVDLKALLPRDMDFKRIHFIVRKSQLYVYLVTTDPAPSGTTESPPELRYGKVVRQLYPQEMKMLRGGTS